LWENDLDPSYRDEMPRQRLCHEGDPYAYVLDWVAN
jgi:hypothetical protein